jgi:phosphoglycerate kinase
VVGPSAQAKAHALTNGDVLLLENVRFEPGEEKNDPELARRLADLADMYVNDAFGAAHRAHASTAGVAALLPAFAGLLMDAEVQALQRLVETPARPFVAILGGAKVSDKIGVITHLIDKVDAILVGGGMANTFLLAQGVDVAASLVEPDRVADARRMLQEADEKGVRIALPIDVIVAGDRDGDPITVSIHDIPAAHAIFDIGPETAAAYEETINAARTLFWNGPMGVFERSQFAEGTRTVAQAVASSGAFSVVGGGDSVAAVEQTGVAAKISHISTGGGASLEFVEGRSLPGIAALEASAAKHS